MKPRSAVGMELHAITQNLAGIGLDHLPGLYALTLLPLILWGLVAATRTAAGRGAPWALGLLAGWSRADLRVRLAVVLMAATAAIHFGLVPGHADDAPIESALFLANGALFVAVAVAAIAGARLWRPIAALLLAATILAYGLFVASGREIVDDLGVVTKLVELMAFGLVVMPRRRSQPSAWRSTGAWAASAAALVLLTTTAGALAWGAGIRDGVGAAHQPVPSAPPTAAERAAALDFAKATWAGIAPYQDVSSALAAGYRPTTPPSQATVHYLNSRYERDHPYMDPSRPQGLVYTGGAHPVLLGAMYELGGKNPAGQSFGGVVTGWHIHQNVCVSIFLDMSGFTTPFGNCPPLSFNITTSPMLHVWRPENPKGQFGELDEAWARRVALAGGVA